MKKTINIRRFRGGINIRTFGFVADERILQDFVEAGKRILLFISTVLEGNNEIGKIKSTF
ncbi:MAG: hypothetical protein JSV03_05745 [Planctomycetota bacterium]|nr:MAG: hypothetical protein JSV03_05745 [Planctomycetota bacterium]